MAGLSEAGMAELRLERVRKVFSDSVHAIDDVSLTAHSGECLALIGPSGCGKTTLLRLIAGLESPTSGEIFVGGKPLRGVPPHARDISLHFQRPALIPNQSVRQNLCWARTLREPWYRAPRLPTVEVSQETRVIEALELGDLLDRPVYELSGGQQQRVALGRCLLRHSRVCLLDEPLGHLDLPLRSSVRRQLRTLLKERSTTVVFVTHDPTEALAVGDRVAVLERGRVVQVDEPAELAQRPGNRFVAEMIHLDRGGINFMPGNLSMRGSVWRFEGELGAWEMPPMKSLSNPQIAHQAANLLSNGEKIYIIIGIAVENMRCFSGPCPPDECVQLKLSAVGQEFSANHPCVIGRHQQGWALVGRANLRQRYRLGQEITMMFSNGHTYGFDGKTGVTLWSPTG